MKKLNLQRPTVIGLIGLPGSGKSTLAGWLVDNIDSLNLVSRDNIRAALFPNCEYTREERDVAFESLCNALRLHIRMAHNVVVDGTCFSSKGSIQQVADIVTAANGHFIGIYCHCPVEVAVRRVESDRFTGKHPALDRNEDLVRRVHSEFAELPSGTPELDMNREIALVGRDALAIVSNCIGLMSS